MTSLNHVYPPLSGGPICLIDDYCDTDLNPNGCKFLPGVKLACDVLMADKPETICSFISGAFTHRFFRKNLMFYRPSLTGAVQSLSTYPVLPA